METLAITIRADTLLSRIISPVTINQSEAVCKKYHIKNEAIDVRAMWDTGSIGTCISSRLAEILNLKTVDSWQLKSIHDSKPANVYILDLTLPDNIIIQNILATEVATGGEFDCIIGMNIIRLGDFSITNDNGKSIMSFRLPAANIPIDFTKEG
jgi:hypothetical protein